MKGKNVANPVFFNNNFLDYIFRERMKHTCYFSSNIILYFLDVNVTEYEGVVTVTTSFGFKLNWNNVAQVVITLRGRYVNNTAGLCGTFDMMSENDYMTSYNAIVHDEIDFANSWKTDQNCPNASYVEHPCITYPSRYSIARQNCSALLSPPFSSCNAVVNATRFINNCEYDMCACMNNESWCLCQSVIPYIDACSRESVVIGNWKDVPGFGMCGKYPNFIVLLIVVFRNMSQSEYKYNFL